MNFKISNICRSELYVILYSLTSNSPIRHIRVIKSVYSVTTTNNNNTRNEKMFAVDLRDHLRTFQVEHRMLQDREEDELKERRRHNELVQELVRLKHYNHCLLRDKHEMVDKLEVGTADYLFLILYSWVIKFNEHRD